MATDSQRNSRALADAGQHRTELPDAWLGAVLVAGGVVSPMELEELGLGPTLWASVVRAGRATERRGGRRGRAPLPPALANLAAAEPRTVTLVPEALARPT